MKRSRLFLLLAFALLAVALSGCMGGAPASSWPGAAANGDLAFVAYNNFVYAVDLSNGTEKWRFPLESEDQKQLFYAPPAVTKDGQVIAGSYNGILYSLNAANGTQNWAFDGASDQFIASPLIADGKIYASSADGNLYALDAKGSLLWTFETEEPVWATPTTRAGCDCLYLTSMDHHIYSISLSDGDLVWKRDLGAAIVGKPALSEDDTLFVGTFGRKMFAINAEDGRVKWEQTVADWVWEGPILVGNNLYFGDLGGNVYALSQRDGTIIWQQTPGGPIVGAPLFLDDTLYFTTRTGEIFAFSPAGEQTWTTTVTEGKLYSPAIASGEDKILVSPTDTDAILIAFPPSGSAPSWSFVPAK